MEQGEYLERCEFNQTNQEGAHAIVADVAKYGGEGSALMQWAGLVLANTVPQDAKAGRLFASGNGSCNCRYRDRMATGGRR
jgi:hypothetical protein